MRLQPSFFLVLDFVRKSKYAVSKKEISQATSLSISTVNEQIAVLQAQGWITSNEKQKSSGGRKPTLYSLNATAGVVVAIDLGATNLAVGISDLQGALLKHHSCPIDVAHGPVPVLDKIRDCVFQLLQEIGKDPGQVVGIGMGVPGPVEFSTGLPSSPPIMPGWDKFPIRSYWAGYFDCPCYVDNDVNLMAIGEFSKRNSNRIDNLIFIKVGTGIGCGIIFNGQIYRGSDGCAGDIGHIDIGRDIECWCGHNGCLEAVSGGRGIAKRAEEIAKNNESEILSQLLTENGTLTASDVSFAANHSDRSSIDLIRESAKLIGQVIASLVNMFNPREIVIGGGLSQMGDMFLASIRESVYKRSLPLATRNLTISTSLLGGSVGMIGAVVLTLEHIFSSDSSLLVGGDYAEYSD